MKPTGIVAADLAEYVKALEAEAKANVNELEQGLEQESELV
jgi:hypothetical protein